MPAELQELRPWVLIDYNHTLAIPDDPKNTPELVQKLALQKQADPWEVRRTLRHTVSRLPEGCSLDEVEEALWYFAIERSDPLAKPPVYNPWKDGGFIIGENRHRLKMANLSVGEQQVLVTYLERVGGGFWENKGLAEPLVEEHKRLGLRMALLTNAGDYTAEALLATLPTIRTYLDPEISGIFRPQWAKSSPDYKVGAIEALARRYMTPEGPPPIYVIDDEPSVAAAVVATGLVTAALLAATPEQLRFYPEKSQRLAAWSTGPDSPYRDRIIRREEGEPMHEGVRRMLQAGGM